MSDAGATEFRSVSGRILIGNTIPFGTEPGASAPGAGFTVSSIQLPAPAPVTANDQGEFTLNNTPIVAGAWLLEATARAGLRVMPALALRTASAARQTIVTFSDDTLTSVAATASITFDRSLAHVVVQLFDAVSPLSGVAVSLDIRSAPAAAYDTARNVVSASASATGPLGVAMFFNVSTPAAGAIIEVVVRRAATSRADAGTPLSYLTPVLPGHVSQINLPMPP